MEQGKWEKRDGVDVEQYRIRLGSLHVFIKSCQKEECQPDIQKDPHWILACPRLALFDTYLSLCSESIDEQRIEAQQEALFAIKRELLRLVKKVDVALGPELAKRGLFSEYELTH